MNSYQSTHSSINSNQNTTTTLTEATKKLDEIMPLLHQASISSNNNSMQYDGERNNNNHNNNSGVIGSNGRSNSHKSYRKRVKTKLSRKAA